MKLQKEPRFINDHNISEWLKELIKKEEDRKEEWPEWWNDDKQEGYIAALKAVNKEFI